MTKPDRVALIDRLTKPIFPKHDSAVSLTEVLLRKEDPEGASAQAVTEGRKPHPFDMDAVFNFLTANPHHSACIGAKVSATVGLGHITEAKKAERRAKMLGQLPTSDTDALQISRIDEMLNPLCASTWQETLWDVCEDFWQVGNGYLEIVRNGGGDEITGIHHVPASEVWVYVEDEQYNKHYEIQGRDSNTGSQVRRFAAYGDKDDFLARSRALKGFQGDSADLSKNAVSEIIHFRRPSSRSRWYGFPDWLSCVADAELVQMIMQFYFDFFLNRGVPELMVLFLGQKLEEEVWSEIKSGLQGNIGLGNSHKSVYANLEVNKETFQVQVEKLAMEDGGEDRFASVKENLAMDIVTAHRVPPLLAGIQIPGKLGATNELPNALMAFQILVIGQAQKLFQQTLASTIGKDMGIALSDWEFLKITEEIDVGQMDTVARMRQTPAQAASEGRDLSRGVKD